jgi:uncharacterized DUF497 family protein
LPVARNVFLAAQLQLIPPGFMAGALHLKLALACYWQYDSNIKEIIFSWDERKDRENQRKHGVSFAEASSAFADENARLRHDPDHSQDEDRFILLGFSAKLRILVVGVSARGESDQDRLGSKSHQERT